MQVVSLVCDDKESRANLKFCIYAKFAYICKLRFALGLDQVQILHIRKFSNFAYTQKWKKCGHIDRFAYTSKICLYAKFAYVSKSSAYMQNLRIYAN